MKYVSYLDESLEFNTPIEWDEMSKELILNNYKEEWVFCDVGSSEGDYCNFFSSLNNVKQIYSFDINENNPRPNGTIHEIMAISDIDGYESYYEHFAFPSKMSNIMGFDVDGNSCKFIKKIPSIKLDTYFNNILVNCLKIDVEGSEYKVINGGITTIKNCDLVIIECHLDSDWPKIFELFESHNLEFYELHTKERIKKNVRPYHIYKLKK